MITYNQAQVGWKSLIKSYKLNILFICGGPTKNYDEV